MRDWPAPPIARHIHHWPPWGTATQANWVVALDHGLRQDLLHCTHCHALDLRGWFDIVSMTDGLSLGVHQCRACHSQADATTQLLPMLEARYDPGRDLQRSLHFPTLKKGEHVADGTTDETDAGIARGDLSGGQGGGRVG